MSETPEQEKGKVILQDYGISEDQKQDLEKRFNFHTPKGNQANRYVLIRTMAHEFAKIITCRCPNSREKSLALTHLEEVSFWSNASIARNE